MGGAGNDFLALGEIAYGGTGNDTIRDAQTAFGEADDDIIENSVFAYGGAGNDTIYGGANTLRMEGGAGADRIYGSSIADLIYAGSGDDGVFGGGGNDTIYGDSGTNYLSGEAGDDTINGGSDTDVILGGAGTDRLYGNDGNDQILGGDGLDYIFGGAGNDEIIGGLGNDEMEGGTGDDRILGGEGDDFLYGNEGADLLDGGTGRNWIEGGAGNDLIILSGSQSTGFGGTLSNRQDGIDTFPSSPDLDARSYGFGLHVGVQRAYGIGVFIGCVYVNQNTNVITETQDFFFDFVIGRGQQGSDHFFFGGATNSESSVVDYQAGVDRVYLRTDTFAGLGNEGQLDANLFEFGAAATRAETRIFYNTSNFHLYYDSDGSGAAEAVDLGSIRGQAFQLSDLYVTDYVPPSAPTEMTEAAIRALPDANQLYGDLLVRFGGATAAESAAQIAEASGAAQTASAAQHADAALASQAEPTLYDQIFTGHDGGSLADNSLASQLMDVGGIVPRMVMTEEIAQHIPLI